MMGEIWFDLLNFVYLFDMVAIEEYENWVIDPIGTNYNDLITI